MQYDVLYVRSTLLVVACSGVQSSKVRLTHRLPCTSIGMIRLDLLLLLLLLIIIIRAIHLSDH